MVSWKNKIKLHIHMWRDLLSEKLWVTQFIVKYHNDIIKNNKYTFTCDVTYHLKDFEQHSLFKSHHGIKEKRIQFHIHMWCDLLPKRLWVTQF